MLTSRTLPSDICSATYVSSDDNEVIKEAACETNGFHSPEPVDTTMHRDCNNSSVSALPDLVGQPSLQRQNNTDSQKQLLHRSYGKVNGLISKKLEERNEIEPDDDETMREPMFSGGYVKRMAARNAMACVNAMFESVKKKKSKGIHTSDLHDTTLFKHTDAVWSDHAEESVPSGSLGKRKSYENNDQFISKRRKQMSSKSHEPTVTKKMISRESSSPSSFSLNTVFSESDLESTESSTASECERVYSEYCDTVPFNILGILYNGNCIHSKTCFYPELSDLSLTSRIIPTVVPTFKQNILLNKKKSILESENDVCKHHSFKGDNGWVPIGNPIKTISINLGKNNIVQRKYFIGIRRKKKEIFSRDSVLLRSGSRKGDIPFVAKISSLWQESGGLMMTVFWYYRREDTDTVTLSQFIEMEVMASQHHDNISVACIDDKCYVLGFKEFCRFRATIEQLPLVKSARSSRSIVKLKQHLSKVKTVSVEFHHLVQSEVYLCFRAYNHIAGKIMKV